MAGAGKNKTATTNVKFWTKTPVNKGLSYIPAYDHTGNVEDARK